MSKISTPSCSECTQTACSYQDKTFPEFCLTKQLDADVVGEVCDLYRGDGADATIAHAAAEVEGLYYGKLTRVEETLAFARRIGAAKIGIASCVGLIEEARTFAKIVRLGGFEPYTVACKVGSVDKTDIGVPQDLKIRKGGFEAACNPALQAQLLNAQHTDLNVVIGLCVGHDSLFIRHSQAPVTVLIVKDRVLGHNPAVALYTIKSYSARLTDAERLRGL
ncbi:MAG TPA: DUF1847 domain-containing protein [Rhodopseudomonas sp.]|uniref:DUF1847 domain-containing protein n=1 Tax=Rhodopseudomonas sp. TaxID=1078 RepID=UPI002ED97D66